VVNGYNQPAVTRIAITTGGDKSGYNQPAVTKMASSNQRKKDVCDNGVRSVHARGKKNNQPVRQWRQSMPQQVILGACCSDATAIE